MDYLFKEFCFKVKVYFRWKEKCEMIVNVKGFLIICLVSELLFFFLWNCFLVIAVVVDGRIIVVV